MSVNVLNFVMAITLCANLYADDNARAALDDVKERENKVKTFVRQELAEGKSPEEVRKDVKKQFFPLIPGNDEYEKLKAEAERVQKNKYRDPDAAEVIEKLSKASKKRSQKPEYQVFN